MMTRIASKRLKKENIDPSTLQIEIDPTIELCNKEVFTRLVDKDHRTKSIFIGKKEL